MLCAGRVHQVPSQFGRQSNWQVSVGALLMFAREFEAAFQAAAGLSRRRYELTRDRQTRQRT